MKETVITFEIMDMHKPSSLLKYVLGCFLLGMSGWSIPLHGGEARLTALEVNGTAKPQTSAWVIRADLEPLQAENEKPIVNLRQNILLQIDAESASGLYQLQAEALRGNLQTLELKVSGQGTIQEVILDEMLDWGVRSDVGGNRFLVIHMQETTTPRTSIECAIRIQYSPAIGMTLKQWEPLRFVQGSPGMSGGYLAVTPAESLRLEPHHDSGLTPIKPTDLPPWFRSQLSEKNQDNLHYRFFQDPYDLKMAILTKDPDIRSVFVEDFQLSGEWKEDAVLFHFKGIARVHHPTGGLLPLLGGEAAMVEVIRADGATLDYREPILYRIRQGDTLAGIAAQFGSTARKIARMNQIDPNLIHTGQSLMIPVPGKASGYIARYARQGSFPLEYKFLAKISRQKGAAVLHFTTIPSAIRPLRIRHLPEGAQLGQTSTVISQGLPDASGTLSFHAASDGPIHLEIRKDYSDEDSKLFFAAETWEESMISPGMMRQSFQTTVRVMQGSMHELAFSIRGEGEIISVESDQLYGWEVVENAGNNGRLLKLKLNEVQTESFNVRIHAQTSMGAFPASAQPMRLFPVNATRYGGWIRIANSGAVRLEVDQASGLSRISPEQLNAQPGGTNLFSDQGKQIFAYRYASTIHELGIRADNIVPEISVSELLIYEIGLADLNIEAELELNIREAPVQEIQVKLPNHYTLSKVQSDELGDYTVRKASTEDEVVLTLQFTGLFEGRRVVTLALEQNTPLEPGVWNLPHIGVMNAKSTRGNIAITADTGLRTLPTLVSGLAETPAGYFPRRLEGIQSAFRIREANWSASFQLERLEQSVQADALHLFTIGEGMAYGSSVMHYFISGAPLDSFEVALSDDYFNLEFTGREVRDWVKTETGYTVFLHNPISGAYTLLASYERPFNARGDTLTFAGIRPSDAQSEQGYTIITSAYQFRVQPVAASGSLSAIEPTEVPPEHRLFIDAPILAAYHYTALPVDLQLELQPLSQGDTLDLVVDRASIRTHVSATGEMLTEATYFIKSQGSAMLPIQLPEDSRLWSVMVNQKTAATVQDANGYQVPIPSEQRPDALQTVQVKWAARTENPNRLTVQTASIGVPVVLAEWVIEPDPGHQLRYRNGNLLPITLPRDVSGWSSLLHIMSGQGAREKDGIIQCILATILGIIAVMVWRFAKGKDAATSRWRFWSGTLLGAASVCVMLGILVHLAHPVLAPDTFDDESSVAFMAPVLDTDTTLTTELDHFEKNQAPVRFFPGILLVFSLMLWVAGTLQPDALRRKIAWSISWMILFGITLSAPHGWSTFIFCLGLFYVVHIAVPWALRLRHGPGFARSAAVAAWALLACLPTGNLKAQTPGMPAASTVQTSPAWKASLLDQEIEIKGDRILVNATLHWTTDKPDTLDLLRDPVILKSIQWTGGKAKVFRRETNGQWVHALAAREAGSFEIIFAYEISPSNNRSTQGFTLPTTMALVHQLTLKVINREVDLLCDQSISSTSQVTEDGHTVASMLLAPAEGARIAVRPRARDASREQAVYFAEWSHMFLPSAGLVEGFHTVFIRLAQGELSLLKIKVPGTWTIADVINHGSDGWRFDPGASILSVPLNPPQQGSFQISLRSQLAAEPLPYTRQANIPSLEGAEREVGMLAVATMPDVQLLDLKPVEMSEIRLEDFSSELHQLAGQALNGDPIVRRAFRYGDGEPTLTVHADAVSSDLRFLTRQTLSLSEDRSVLGVECQVDISRAGVFRLRFPLPDDMDVESVSGSALSHWTEMTRDETRYITLHFHDKTIGRTDIQLSLAGPGPVAGGRWEVPRVRFEEASKQTGQLTLSSEQGLRLQVVNQEGVVQLDPEELGLGNKNASVFRLLFQDWNMLLDVTQLPPWIQTDGLQYIQLSEGRGEAQTRFNYQIRNAGVKELRVALPSDAEGVRFQGEHISDFIASDMDGNDDRLQWSVKLDRRVIGAYKLRVLYTIPMPADAMTFTVQGDLALDARLQRGYVAVGLEGRLRGTLEALPPELQVIEWLSIPSEWNQSVQAAAARLSFRLIQPEYQFRLNLQKRKVAKLLPAQVQRVNLRSVVSDNGMILTEIKMELNPGDKRLLPIALPDGTRFWFALINGHSVWPWESGGKILIPLEAASEPNKPTVVEFLYTSNLGYSGRSQLRLELVGPEFDLPLENVTWEVFLDKKWQLHRHEGSLQLAQGASGLVSTTMNWDQYFQEQSRIQKEQTQTAEQFLNLGNELLIKGDPQYARKAFEHAYGLSRHDAAFNEDARVQLHNLKTKQAFLSLNFRNNYVQNQTVTSDPSSSDNNQPGSQLQFKPEDYEQLVVKNSDDINTAFNNQAERIIRQQEAAVEKPQLLKATFPKHGNTYTFQQSMQVGDWSKLHLSIEAQQATTGISAWTQTGWLLLLGGAVLGMLMLGKPDDIQ
ncbi:MAG: LysM peptidoglycan-binding domain-containing protein [Verrucomicrobiota bacterium]|nr:LysM peptidoglycan-binding domain-containing protein [Verrucomicrobiota bacterium]